MNHYSKQIKSDNFDELFYKTVTCLLEEGRWTNPRGFRCKELIAPQLILTNPRDCLITIKERKLNYAYLIIEKMMYLSQDCYNDVLIAYNKKMQDYINPKTNEFDGAYGPRIGENKQLLYCFNELSNDPDSRRAVITIHNSTDCHETRDSACTLSLNFLIRDGKLDMITTMRSNDILWGTCLDIPAFCFIQEVMAYWLKLPLGNYIHNAASLHYYDNFENKLKDIIKDGNEVNERTNPDWDISIEDTPEALDLFWLEEERIRKYNYYNVTKYKVVNDYLEQLMKYWEYKMK